MAEAKPKTPPPAKKFKLGGMKNWLIVGVAGVVGYYAYEKFVKPELADINKDIKTAGKKAATKAVQGPDLNGPMVKKNEIASTRSKICIATPVKGFMYSPISSVNAVTGYRTFSATVAGHFTRRLLCRGSQSWAEIAPLRTSV